jgi:beta-glucanase (GH16 family)
MKSCCLQLACLALCLVEYGKSGWIDPDTKENDKSITSFANERKFDLIFSDEFNVDDRFFYDGYDPKWTSLHKDDYTNYALQYYNSSLVRTKGGFLNISTVIQDITYDVFDIRHSPPSYKNTKNFQSGMIQGWNKFCFTGGIIEISAKLPGKHNIGGLWPAMWLLGNLARATYVGSSNNIWPWSYNKCDEKHREQQLITACNRLNHFDLNRRQGRGAPEIDILEAMAGDEKDLPNTPISKPYYSASLQIAPGYEDYRPNNAERPQSGMWYDPQFQEYGVNSSLNVFFYGNYLEGAQKDKSYVSDALSANRDLLPSHFNDQHIYRVEWKSGKDGYVVWYLDDVFVYRINAPALDLTGAIMPEEPM